VTQVIPRESKRITYSSEIRALKFIPFTAEQLSIVNGSMLGDGYIHNNGWPSTSKNYVFSKMHSVKQKEYVEWVFQKLKPFVHSPPKLYVPTQALRLRTVSHATFTALRAIFYRDGRKILPNTIELIMADPLSVAVWFMDDGGIARRKDGEVKGYLLNTQSFTHEENGKIAALLEEKHGIHAIVTRNHKYYRVEIYQKESRNRFRNLIEKFILPSMQYKIG
jgi:hypothetical protein